MPGIGAAWGLKRNIDFFCVVCPPCAPVGLSVKTWIVVFLACSRYTKYAEMGFFMVLYSGFSW
jgi:hypothetical protein